MLPATHTLIHEWNEPSCLNSVSIHQMASPERGSAHSITAHYPLIDLERMNRPSCAVHTLFIKL